MNTKELLSNKNILEIEPEKEEHTKETNKKVEQSKEKTITALCKLNIRQKKSKDSKVVKLIRAHESFNIKDNDTNWYDVIENGKTIGYLLKMDDTIK